MTNRELKQWIGIQAALGAIAAGLVLSGCEPTQAGPTTTRVYEPVVARPAPSPTPALPYRAQLEKDLANAPERELDASEADAWVDRLAWGARTASNTAGDRYASLRALADPRLRFGSLSRKSRDRLRNAAVTAMYEERLTTREAAFAILTRFELLRELEPRQTEGLLLALDVRRADESLFPRIKERRQQMIEAILAAHPDGGRS